ncbi:unnamed protein product [Phytophthora fragariaefolia]|uniref:Unnamed protein product n=1 Tax=Phytophthora fragariaefolia TaxID=1490495 RepID=A0A9W6X2D0_9STRA|nr:unnamed protein product [Phytophthora fragariaefolia]
MHAPPNDSSILEWLLRSNTPDEGQWPKPDLQILPTTAMPYFEVPDEPYHGVEIDLTSALVSHPAMTTTTTTTTTTSDVRTSEMTKPSLRFGDM